VAALHLSGAGWKSDCFQLLWGSGRVALLHGLGHVERDHTRALRSFRPQKEKLRPLVRLFGCRLQGVSGQKLVARPLRAPSQPLKFVPCASGASVRNSCGLSLTRGRRDRGEATVAGVVPKNDSPDHAAHQTLGRQRSSEVGQTNVQPLARGLRLTRCNDCGELRGGSCLCLCDGLVCAACGRDRIRRPISAYYDESTGEIIHVPYFTGLKPCRLCDAWSRWEPAQPDQD
jgi:hypothetical protein